MKDHKTRGFVCIIVGGALLLIGIAPFAFYLIMATCGYLLVAMGLKLWHMPPLYIIIQYLIDDLQRKFF
jgi:hypothetical protein